MLRKEHFTKANLTDLGSCYLDQKGNFIFLGRGQEVGIHEKMAEYVIREFYDLKTSDEWWDWYDENISNHFSRYKYEHLESLGFVRFMHWVNRPFGRFVIDEQILTYAQKLAIREYCRANNCNWETVIR